MQILPLCGMLNPTVMRRHVQRQPLGSQTISKANTRSEASSKVVQRKMHIVGPVTHCWHSTVTAVQCCYCIWDWAKSLQNMSRYSKHACSGLRSSLIPAMVAATKGVGMTMRSSSACLTTSAMSVLALKPSGALCPCVTAALLRHLR